MGTRRTYIFIGGRYQLYQFNGCATFNTTKPTVKLEYNWCGEMTFECDAKEWCKNGNP